MEGWRELPLGEVLTFQRGFDITREQQFDGPYKVISSSGPKSTHSEFKVKGPGVVIGRKGTLGCVYYSVANFWPHDTTLWVKDFHGNDPQFAYYFLQSMHFERLDAGASNPTLNRNHIHVLPVLWPSQPMQRRIAGILAAYDDLIENNQRRIKILEEMARSLYREWFVHFRYPGHENVPLVDSALGPIPRGWRVASVQDLVTRCAQGRVFQEADTAPEGEVPVFDQSTGCRLGFHSGVPDNPATPDRPRTLFGDHTCKLQIIAQPFSVGPNVVVFEPKGPTPMYYLHHALHGLVSTHEYKRHTRTLMAKSVVVANRPIADRFSEMVKQLCTGDEALTRQSENLRRTRDLLLPRLLSGQLDVSSLPDPEP